jgi:hypothetical protein
MEDHHEHQETITILTNQIIEYESYIKIQLE